jgi:DNA-binding NtrC family response regulator
MSNMRPHILVVDDAPGVCALVEAALEEVGMRVSSALDATQAREILAAGPVDLAIVDVVLGGESGFATAQQAMRHGARVLLMSGFADTGEADLPLPFIAKPFAIRDLVDVVSLLAKAEAIS